MIGEASTTRRMPSLAAACDTTLPFTTGGDAEWFAQTSEYNNDGDAAQSGAIVTNESTWLEATVEGPGTVSFDYKLSSATGDSLNFFIDDQYQWGVSSGGWSQSGPWTVTGSGTHTLKWTYSKDSGGSSAGEAWVDNVQWSGDVPDSGGDWSQIEYTPDQVEGRLYDPSGRRIAKDVDGAITKYLYDGSHCIAEYDANDVLLRKYIYGPGVDQPICMIDVADSNAAYYYHFDALG